MNFIIIALACVLIVGITIGIHYLIRAMFKFRIAKNGIEILLFGIFRLENIRFSNISEIEKVALGNTYLPRSIFSATVLGTPRRGGKTVLLKLHKGVRLPFSRALRPTNVFYFFPENADDFVRQVQQTLLENQER